MYITHDASLLSAQQNTPDTETGNTAACEELSVRIPRLRARNAWYLFGYFLKLADMVGIFLAIGVLLHFSGSSVLSMSVGDFLPLVIIPTCTIIGIIATHGYALTYRQPIMLHLSRVALGSLLGLIAASFVTRIIFGHWMGLSHSAVWALILLVHLISHASLAIAHRILSRSGRLTETVIIVGATENARKLIARNVQSQELNIVGIFDDRLARAPSDISGVPVLGRLDDMISWHQLPDIDRIVITVTSDARERARHLIDRMRGLPQQIVLLLDLEGFDPETENLASLAHAPGAVVSGAPDNIRRQLIKRTSDIVFASILLLLFSPFALAIAIAVKLDSPGPILFRQRRQGFNNQIIRVWKFRSMKTDRLAEKKMQSQTTADDPRVTRIGRFIRSTSLDEIPQLINVLMGDMSLVGPRPHAVGMTTESTEVHGIVSDYAHRHRVKPGLTGWAQVNGSRGPLHTKADVRERVRFDLEYVNRSSFWFDLYIMIITAPCLLGDKTRQR